MQQRFSSWITFVTRTVTASVVFAFAIASGGANPQDVNDSTTGDTLGIGMPAPISRHSANEMTSVPNESDTRWKRDVTPLRGALDIVSKLQGVSYSWRTDEFPDRHFSDGPQLGFIAQDVERVLPQVVTTNYNGYKIVSYEGLTPVLVEAVKELKSENDQDVEQIKALTARLDAIEANRAGVTR
jgi:hypothetical protein